MPDAPDPKIFDLDRIIREEIAAFVRENRNEIHRRVRARIKAEKQKQDEATSK